MKKGNKEEADNYNIVLRKIIYSSYKSQSVKVFKKCDLIGEEQAEFRSGF